jgi:CubicO group peptidase (beta-lactamase class C family)
MKRMYWAMVIACCISACLPGSIRGTDITAPSVSTTEAVLLLESWLQSLIDYDRLPGVSVAVVHDQEIVYAGGFGYADIDGQTPSTANTVYSICSITKLFTAIAVLQLRDAGLLSLDDPVSDFLPWFSPAPSDTGAAPTLRALLRHSGGLPCEPDLTVWRDPEQLFPTRAQLVDRVSRLKMSYAPDTRYNYSNLGYALLGQVVSTVSGSEYTEYVRQHILAPLGLQHTTLFPPDSTSGDPLATGYGPWPRSGSRKTVASRFARTLIPAGGYASTVLDLAEFAKWQFRVLAGAEDRVLCRETLQEMHTLQWETPSWGLGFSIWQMGGQNFVGHWGGCPGYKSQIILCPEEKIAVVAMINATDAPQFTIVFRTYEIMASALTGGVDRPAAWTEYTGYYTGAKTWSDAEVLEWEGGLAVMWVPTGDPVGSLAKLRRVDGNVFRQVNGDGSPGKHYVFDTGADGGITRMKFNNNLLEKSTR